MIDLELGKPNQIEFSIAISGIADMSTPIVSLSIFCNNMKMVFEATRSSEKSFINIPKLDLNVGEYECQFEVVIEDRIYIPHKDIIKYSLSKNPQISISPKESNIKDLSSIKNLIPIDKKREIDLTLENVTLKTIPIKKEVSSNRIKPKLTKKGII